MGAFGKIFNLFVQRLIKLFLLLAPQLEKVIALSQFGDRFLLKTLSLAYKIFLAILYPYSLVRVLVFLELKDSSVTEYARNFSFLVNWFMIVLMFWNETFVNGNVLLSQLRCWTKELMEVQTAKENLMMLLRFTVKAAFLSYMTLKINYGKYFFQVKQNSTVLDEFLKPVLLLPFAIIAATSNRIFITNTVIKNSLFQISKRLQSSSNAIDESSEKHIQLHNFFVQFHKANVKNLIAIIVCCAMNTTYQVTIGSRYFNCF